MKHWTVPRFFLIGVLFAVVVGTLCLYALRAFNESSSVDARRHMVLMIAQTVESGPYNETVRDVKNPSGRRVGSNLWVLNEEGRTLATNADTTDLPGDWESLEKPTETHDFTMHYRPMHMAPALFLVKLSAPQPTYLLIEARKIPSLAILIWAQGAFILFILAIAVITAAGLTSGYMRRKSLEAREVLARLEGGDLKARFEIRRIDEVGSLMLDFNRMAGEIERLVHRVEETENARKHLLEELSHDLRTPLTSLRTSIDTLTAHSEEMSSEQRKEFLNISSNELNYFLRLLDDLFFVADLGEPRYKKTSERVDIAKFVSVEIKARQTQQPHLRWEFDAEDVKDTATGGDPVLLRRLFKNAFDNAAKHARDQIQVHIENGKQSLIIHIDDDGPGISDQAIEVFGQRRRQRITEGGRGVSLGLGSVIMRTLLELHGGALQIQRRINSVGVSEGTRLTLTLPKA